MANLKKSLHKLGSFPWVVFTSNSSKLRTNFENLEKKWPNLTLPMRVLQNTDPTYGDLTVFSDPSYGKTSKKHPKSGSIISITYIE